LWEHKNHLRLLDALAALKARGLTVPLVLAGGAKHAYHRVLERIAHHGLGDQVRLLGYVPDAEIPSLYRAAEACIYVSLFGPTNIPPLEAMALGCPLVVSRLYAMPEQVGDAALLVNPWGAADIARGVERIWTDEALRRELARRGRERVGRWTEAGFGERLREIVSGLVGARLR
jgi:glycosyltransferase involved in cell wall biosynthesis